MQINTYTDNSNIFLYGHYRVGSKIFYNRIEALMHQIETKSPVTFHVFNDILDSVDVTVEPDEQIETLYARRAIELRNSYDYLILHFSGGRDSLKIAEIFIDNGLVIDEFLINVRYDRQRREQYMNISDPDSIEIEEQSIPLANLIKENHWPHLKITVNEQQNQLIKFLVDNPDWMEKRVHHTTDPNCILRSDFDRFNTDWQKMAHRGVKIGHLIGKEKPFLTRDETGFFIYYDDRDQSDWIVPRGLDWDPSLPQYKELFFSHPSTIRMQLKQSHMIRKVWDLYPVLSVYDRYTDSRGFGRAVEDTLADIIYGPSKFPQFSIFPKTNDIDIGKKSKLWKTHSKWFLDNLSEAPVRAWFKGMDSIYDRLRPLYKSKIDFYRGGVPGFNTKKYYIHYHEKA